MSNCSTRYEQAEQQELHPREVLAPNDKARVPFDCWIANLSNGETVIEKEHRDVKSPWQRLMERCDKEDLYITRLRLQLGTVGSIETKAHAEGYAFLRAQRAIMGIKGDEELDVMHGIGVVEREIRPTPSGPKEMLVVKFKWAKRDRTNTGRIELWDETRLAHTVRSVIWSKKPGTALVQ